LKHIIDFFFNLSVLFFLLANIVFFVDFGSFCMAPLLGSRDDVVMMWS